MLDTLKQKTLNLLKTKGFCSHIVPFTDQFSNSFYENLVEIWDLRKILINEGLMENRGLIQSGTAFNSKINTPYRN